MMGDSAGRSKAHRTGEGAQRRYTERERLNVDPPWLVQPPTVSVPMRRASWVALGAVLFITLGSLVLWGLFAA